MSESVRDMLAREADEAEARADAEERGDAPPTPGHRARRSSADPTQVCAVRCPESRLAELRQVADELGEPPTALIRRWVLERLDQHNAPADLQHALQPFAQQRGQLGERHHRQNPWG